MDEQYKSILEELAKRKMEQNPTLIAQNREPASINVLPVSGSDTQMIQDLNILDKIRMKAKGLDPWNPNDVEKYRNSGTEVQMADGGEVPSRKTIELDSPQFIPSTGENVRFTLKPKPQGEPIDYNALNNALKKVQEPSVAPEIQKEDLKSQDLETPEKSKEMNIQEPENYQERMTSQKKVEDLVGELQAIPDENISERIKRFHEIIKTDLTPLEKQKLEQWADDDWNRYLQREEQINKENK